MKKGRQEWALCWLVPDKSAPDGMRKGMKCFKTELAARAALRKKEATLPKRAMVFVECFTRLDSGPTSSRKPLP